ncbi:hypothetical protein [Microbacterium trichothecenolyticum]|uniref:5-methylcytosine-specific restriction endonuclease McrA n=1 Tax=Microbacterium trichothecenolyticum TaxID=69370 RepID=A0ABU0TRS2_MICTR|nr:hypothetical protein [Microbacterium trichothecenolyticum]MDQ1122160.1 5-methylcytosine-specific restriction endonuclease McrA [Microbacterium trichothecenolyticum]
MTERGTYTTTNANGARRRALVKRVRAEESTCALCDKPVNPTITVQHGQHGSKCPTRDCTGCVPHPMRGEVDEDIPRSRGGSPYDRENCHLMHRKCNQYKGNLTLAEARAKLATTTTTHRVVICSPIW